MLQRYSSFNNSLRALAVIALALFMPRVHAQSLTSDQLAAGVENLATIGSVVPGDVGAPALGGVPPNTLCTGATIEELAVGASVVRNGDNTGALTDGIFGVGVVWEAFTTTECADITIAYCGTTPAFSAALLYLGTGCPLTNYAIVGQGNVTNQNCGDGNFEISLPQLSPGTYYYPVMMIPGSSEGPYTLTFSADACTNAAPDNAVCAGAIELQVNESCVPVDGSLENATVSGTVSGGCEDGDPSDGVWFSFVAVGTDVVVSIDPSANISAVVDVFSGDCSAPTLIDCFVASTFDVDIDLELNGLTVGNTYYLRVYDWFNGQAASNSFSICLTGQSGVQCSADAGTLTADDESLCLEEGPVTFTATGNGDAVVPTGYQSLFVLTVGEDQTIVAAAGSASFELTAVGGFTMHTLVYDPNTLDLGSIEFGVTTAAEVNALLIQGGGSICAALDLVGTSITVTQFCCDADAGTLTADGQAPCYDGAPLTLSATANGDAVVPDGYETIYVLTMGEGLVIMQTAATPSFDVDATGSYTIHTLVYDPATLDLGIVEPGVTTGFDVNALLIQGGGSICASLDVAGAPIVVELCCDAVAGTLTADASTVCFVDDMATISAAANGDAVVPDGYEAVYVLTMGEGLVIVQTAATPSFDVDATGSYTIHTLVYDPTTLDLGIVEPGVTTGFDVNALLIQGGGSICGSLDVAGAPILVQLCCDANAGTLTAAEPTVCFVDGMTSIAATGNGDIFVPAGFQKVFILSLGEDQIIVQANADPSFDVTEVGAFTIHTLVYDPNTLDLGTIEFGVTSITDVKLVLIQGGGTICGSLDTDGASIAVELCCDADAGTLTANLETVCLVGEVAVIRATPNEDSVVPDGFETIYVLTMGEELLIVQVSGESSFEVDMAGSYTIHTLVYDPLTLDLGIVEIGVTTGFDVNALLIQGGGTICASLDVSGAATTVLDCVPVNDDCANAVALPINLPENCPSAAITGDNTYATQEDGNEPGCDATNAAFADVWYTFNSGMNTEVTLTLDQMDMANWAVTVSDACTGGTEIACEIAPDAPIVLTTTENTDYWVRVYSNLEFGEGGAFTLCLSGAMPTFVCDGGEVAGNGGAVSINVCQNTVVDVIDFSTNSASIEEYSYVVTDESDAIVALMVGNSMDFNMLALGNYRVYGVSHNGVLEGTDPGSAVSEITTTGGCLELSSNFVLVTVEICSGISNEVATMWNLFPNPSKVDFSIRYAGSNASTLIEVIDMEGRLVLQESASLTQGQVHTVSTTGRVAPGMYTVRLIADGQVKNLRLTIE
ncbi:MAG: T9SS type A sorting domain-containing protein [Flavobacteriales bacterium]